MQTVASDARASQHEWNPERPTMTWRDAGITWQEDRGGVAFLEIDDESAYRSFFPGEPADVERAAQLLAALAIPAAVYDEALDDWACDQARRRAELLTERAWGDVEVCA